MPKHSYKQLEEVYQKGVNKEHKQNIARTHPMSSRQGKGHQDMPTTQRQHSIHKILSRTVTKTLKSQQ